MNFEINNPIHKKASNYNRKNPLNNKKISKMNSQKIIDRNNLENNLVTLEEDSLDCSIEDDILIEKFVLVETIECGKEINATFISHDNLKNQNQEKEGEVFHVEEVVDIEEDVDGSDVKNKNQEENNIDDDMEQLGEDLIRKLLIQMEISNDRYKKQENVSNHLLKKLEKLEQGNK